MPFHLILTLQDNGALEVKGPIANKIMCYGILEAAKESIKAFNEKNAGLIQPAPMTLLPPMKS